jgi:uncharacterized protein (TIGR02646 family)
VRRLVRPQVDLPTLRTIERRGAGWMSGDGPSPADGRWNEADVRGALYAMHGQGCAYCQKGLTGNRGHVEHFRPQAIYPWLKYNFVNYLLSCDTCNEVYKREKFPLKGSSRPYDFAQRDHLDRETRLLIDPVFDDAEGWMSFDILEPICPAVSKNPSDATAEERTHSTITFFELNTDVRLIKLRFEAVNHALEILDAISPVNGAGNEALEAELRKSASRYRPHGIAIRAALESLAPELLPTRKEEVLWLVDDYLKDLTTIDSIRSGYQEEERSRRLDREEAECCYALAVLMKDPPAGSPTEIQQLVGQAGRLAQITSYFNRL